MSARIAILDYGMGNLRSVEKALEHVGATATVTADPARCASADGVILPGVGAFPRAMERVRERGLDAARSPSASRRGCRCSGSASACSCSSSRAPSSAAPTGLGLLPGPVEGLDAPGLKVPHIGWAPVRWERESRLTEGIESETPFYFVHSFVARPAADDLLGSAEYGERFACAAERGNVFGVQFHPEKSSAAGLRLLANFAGVCAAVPPERAPAMILYPAIDIRGGRAVRLVEGDYDRETEYDADPVDAAHALGRRRLALPPRRRPRRGQSGRAGEPRDWCGGSPTRSRSRSRSAAACATPSASSNVLRAGAERVVIGTAALRDPRFLQEMLDAHGERVAVGGRRPRRQRLAGRLDRDHRGAGRPRRSPS